MNACTKWYAKRTVWAALLLTAFFCSACSPIPVVPKSKDGRAFEGSWRAKENQAECEAFNRENEITYSCDSRDMTMRVIHFQPAPSVSAGAVVQNNDDAGIIAGANMSVVAGGRTWPVFPSLGLSYNYSAANNRHLLSPVISLNLILALSLEAGYVQELSAAHWGKGFVLGASLDLVALLVLVAAWTEELPFFVPYFEYIRLTDSDWKSGTVFGLRVVFYTSEFKRVLFNK